MSNQRYAIFIACLVMLISICVQGGRWIGARNAERKHLTMIETCTSKELDSRGLAECNDPNYQVRELPSGTRLVAHFGELHNDLRYVPSNVLFAPKDYAFMVDKMYIWDDDPLEGMLIDDGEVSITISSGLSPGNADGTPHYITTTGGYVR